MSKEITALAPPSMTIRLLLLLRGNTLSGLEDLFLPLFQPSKKCGSPRRNMMTLAPRLSTESAHKLETRNKGSSCSFESWWSLVALLVEAVLATLWFGWRLTRFNLSFDFLDFELLEFENE